MSLQDKLDGLEINKSPSVSVPHVRLPATERRKLLMHCAINCFSKNGFHSTSMEEIAAAAGVTKPVIYQHFPSKRQLYADLLNQVGTELCTSIRVATESANSPHQRVEQGFDAYFRFACHNRAGYELLFGSGPRRDTQFRDAIVRIEDEIAQLVTSKIEADIDDNHRRFLALGVISLAEGTLRRWFATLDEETYPPYKPVPYETTDAKLWAKRITELAWAGLKGIQKD